MRFHQHEFLKAGIWQLHLFMHFADRDSLAQVMMRQRAAGLLMPALMVIGIAAQVLEALRFLHTEQRIAHRDIKPPNIMLRSDGRVMLQDFGNSRFSDSTQPDTDFETFVGCAQYMSPERICGAKYSFKADVWSLGLIMLEVSLSLSLSLSIYLSIYLVLIMLIYLHVIYIVPPGGVPVPQVHAKQWCQ